MKPEPDKSIVDFALKLAKCVSMDQAWDAFCGALEQFGVKHACYGFMPVHPRKSITREVLRWDSHKPEFTNAYFEGGHPDHDWSVEWSMTRTEAQPWGKPEIVSRLSQRQKETEELAYDFGLHEGIVIPIRGATQMSWGGIGLAAPDMPAREWASLLNSHQSKLEALSQAFHETVLQHGYFGHYRLSPRESEVLRLVVCGLNKHDIAERLNISHKTSEVHLYNIRRKLNCVNDIQVAVKALVFNLVTL